MIEYQNYLTPEELEAKIKAELEPEIQARIRKAEDQERANAYSRGRRDAEYRQSMWHKGLGLAAIIVSGVLVYFGATTIAVWSGEASAKSEARSQWAAQCVMDGGVLYKALDSTHTDDPVYCVVGKVVSSR